jgi:hypothetical protein
MFLPDKYYAPWRIKTLGPVSIRYLVLVLMCCQSLVVGGDKVSG